MSGSSGGGGGVYEPTDSPCESLVVETTLNSPNPKATIAVGDLLAVEIQSGKVPIAVCVTKDGTVAGSLTFGEVRRLIRCMEEGHAYTAEVLSIDGGRRTVKITHA